MINRKIEVGRIVMRQSQFRDGFFRPGGVITKVTELRVVFLHHFTNEKIAMSKATVSAVCDTPAEVELLMAYETSARIQRAALVTAQSNACKEKFGL
jgi:hypothetical protein